MLLDALEKFVIAVLILSPLEHLLPRREKKILRDKWVTDLLYMFVAVFLISLLTTGVLTIGVVLFQPFIGESVKAWVGGQSLIPQIIAIMIIADFGYYVMHRMHHEIPFLWKYHAVHHSIEELDWLATHRVHPIDQALTRGISLSFRSLRSGFRQRQLLSGPLSLRGTLCSNIRTSSSTLARCAGCLLNPFIIIGTTRMRHMPLIKTIWVSFLFRTFYSAPRLWNISRDPLSKGQIPMYRMILSAS